MALTHPSVMDAAAYGVPSELGEEEVKLDVVLREPIGVQELHAWLGQNVPRYMVPRYLEIRESFPKTPSERVEKYKLQTSRSTARRCSTRAALRGAAEADRGRRDLGPAAH